MTQPNKSLREKSAARLAAAQILYSAALRHEPVDVKCIMEDYGDYMGKVRPNMALLHKLLEGVATHGTRLESWLDKTLTGTWKKERMSPLMLAILRLAIFELADSQTAAPVIVSEYVTLASQFFNEQETGFVNAALNSIAVELRH